MPSDLALFFSYSSRDETLREELETHLSVLRRDGVIAPWGFRRIVPGEQWEDVISDKLAEADIVLLLITAHFLNSDYCWGIELATALRRHESGEATVIPIILRDCDWKTQRFARLQVLPPGGRPVTRFRPRDAGWTDVVLGIRRAAEMHQLKIQERQARLTATDNVNAQATEAPAAGPAATVESIALDFFVPIGGLRQTTAYGGYPFILYSASPAIVVLPGEDYIEIELVPDRELIEELDQIYLLKQPGALVFPYQSMRDAFRDRFYRTDFVTINVDFVSVQGSQSFSSIVLTRGTGDEYRELEIYRHVTDDLSDRAMRCRVVLEDPDFIDTFVGVILSTGIGDLVVSTRSVQPGDHGENGGGA